MEGHKRSSRKKELVMKERFSINEIHICTFERINNLFKPNLNEYPLRFCVVDKSNGIVIDIEHELKYDYVETVSGLYFINESMKKIRDNKRAAIFPMTLIDIDEDIRKRANNIINRLKSGEEFKDGNDVLGNEEYLNIVAKEKNGTQKQLQKTMMIGKNGK